MCGCGVKPTPRSLLGRFKWIELGLDYSLQDIEPPAQDLIQRVIGRFAKEGLQGRPEGILMSLASAARCHGSATSIHTNGFRTSRNSNFLKSASVVYRVLISCCRSNAARWASGTRFPRAVNPRVTSRYTLRKFSSSQITRVRDKPVSDSMFRSASVGERGSAKIRG